MMIFLRLSFLLLCSICTSHGQPQSQHSQPIFINCGTSRTVVSDGRIWIGDETAQNLTITSSGDVLSTPSQPTNSMYATARAFNTSANYTFKLSPGHFFLRLHFYPHLLGNLNVNDSAFGVTANTLKLLSNFNVMTEILRQNSYLRTLGSNITHSAIVKEYFLDVGIDALLTLKFFPDKNSFAYIDAIEVIPVSQALFSDSVKVSDNMPNLSMDRKGMETMYRLNVGGPVIQRDRDELWRRWDNDHPYMFAADASRLISNTSNLSYVTSDIFPAAPLLVYADARIMTNAEVMEKRFNMSWKFEANPNFDYLVRLHFCELQYDSANQRVFRIYISNNTASENFDVYVKARGKNKAFYQDYVDSLSQVVDTLWIQLGPDIAAAAPDTDALLNGLEIFKISKSGNLAYTYESADDESNDAAHGKPRNRILFAVIGGIAVLITLTALSCAFLYLFCRRKTKALEKNQPAGWRPLFLHANATVKSTNDARSSQFQSNLDVSMGTNRIGRRFTIIEIRTATKNFDESLVIGTGGFGKVYKGEIDDGEVVAIKRAHPHSGQGLAEFETEIEMLSKLRHRHLVSMIGFCEEQKEMILVYEYMANGTLRSLLFGNDLTPLLWKQRLEACIGAARGLHYLHTGAEGGIIHRDVKTTNILLDENFVAKVADFGLSKSGPSLDRTHVSTAVKGSFGYLDPEYFRRQRLTEKSDVYSFGVVLFEVVCGRPVINPSLPREQINLVEWAIKWQRAGLLENIIDPNLEGSYSLDSLRKLGSIAEKCLADEGKNRPTIGEVLWHLEYVSQLHEASVSSEGGCFSRPDVRFTNALYNLPNIEEMGSPNSSNEDQSQELKRVPAANLSADVGSENAPEKAEFQNNMDRFGR